MTILYLVVTPPRPPMVRSRRMWPRDSRSASDRHTLERDSSVAVARDVKDGQHSPVAGFAHVARVSKTSLLVGLPALTARIVTMYGRGFGSPTGPSPHCCGSAAAGPLDCGVACEIWRDAILTDRVDLHRPSNHSGCRASPGVLAPRAASCRFYLSVPFPARAVYTFCGGIGGSGGFWRNWRTKLTPTRKPP